MEKNNIPPTRDLTIRSYSERILRFTYGEQPKDITDSFSSELHPAICQADKRILQFPDFSVKIGENGEVSIWDLSGRPILEDAGPIRYSAVDDDAEVEEQEYDILNRERGKIYAHIIKRKINGERAFYGLGEKYGSLNLLGRETENWNTDVLGVSPVHTAAQKTYHTNIPFYIGTDGKHFYGIYHHLSYRNSFDFGKYSADLTFKADGGLPDYFFFFGRSLGEIVRSYGQLTGRMPLPRRDFLGYQQCRWSYKSAAEVLELAREFRERKIPADVIYLDIDYMDHYKVFTQDPHAFPDFRGMIEKLKKMNFKLVVIIDPGVKVEKGYPLYDQGRKKDYFLKDSQGKDYVGQVWPGESVFPDFLREEVRAWWGIFVQGLEELGVEGIWNDMNEPADMSTPSKTVPEECRQRTDSGEIRLQKETHNLYGHYHGKATYDALCPSSGDNHRKRPFVLTRSASPGTQRYASLWTGDNTSLWEHMAASIPMLLNLGLSGFTFVGSDIGGFVGDGEPELLIRWSQLGVCYPLCRNHSSINSLHQEPWAFGAETERAVKMAIKLRYSLISELYQLFHNSSVKGDPVMRPMCYHESGEGEILHMDDQFFLGEDLLAAPVLHKGARHRMVYFPEGRWYDAETDQIYQEGYRVIEAPLDKLPLFVREGAILLRDRPAQHLGGSYTAPELHIYSGPDRERTLYFDDGLTFHYREGKYTLVKVSSREGHVSMETEKKDFPLGDLTIVKHGFSQ